MSSPCGACGAIDLLEGAKFCRECGAEVPPPPADERPRLSEDSRCPDCDSLLVHDALYCHRCAASVSDERERPELADAAIAGDESVVLSASAAAESGRDEAAVPPDEGLAATPDAPRPTVPADIGNGTGVTMIALSAKYAPTVSEAPTAISKEPDSPRVAASPAAPSPPQKACSRCGAAAAETAKFCRSCGSALDAAEALSADSIRCAGCGAQVQPSAAFCRHCGTSLAERETPRPPVMEASRCTICGAHDAGPSGLCTQCARTMAT